MKKSVYLVALCDLEESWIESVYAKSFKEAEEKFIEDFIDTYDIKEPLNWRECKLYMRKKDIIIGSISDIEEY